jgi:uncharacterized membrane protein (UPF0127 family)
VTRGLPGATLLATTLAAVLAAALAAACGAAPGTPAAPTPAPPAASGPRAILPSGAVYRLELALNPEDQAQGLMYRENLPEKTGMLFVFPETAPHHFWMKNTMIPLDMIWMDETGRVVFVSANTPPCEADPCPTYGPDTPVRLVLEIAGGKAAAEKVAVGSSIRIRDVPR